MEPDGITRVYITSAAKGAWLVFPEETPYEACLRGAAARRVLDRADFHAVNSESFNWGNKVRDEWGVFPKPDGAHFSVNRKGWKYSEHYSKLAKILEKRTGKKGLTILVS
jgi:hypothetical protein